MGRTIAGVVVGYIALAAVVFLGLSVAFLALGVERSFKEGTFQPSTLWLAVMFIDSVLAALVGGWVCRVIARRPRPVLVLACIALVLGCVEGGFAVANPKGDPGPRLGDVAVMEAATKAQTPAWVSFANAAIGFVFICVGGRALGAGPHQAPSDAGVSTS